MPSFDTVTFGIPLISRSAAQDWASVEHQLNATVGSIYNQTDGRFRIILAGTDRPNLAVSTDQRFEFIAVEQLPALDHTTYVSDGNRKRYRIAQRLRQYGGGYLMLADADDLVSRRLVAHVLATRNPNGYSIGRGYMFDAVHGWLAPFPFTEDARFDWESHTCAVFALTADELPQDDDDQANRFGYLMERGHPAFRKRAAAEGRPFEDIPFRAAVYVRNTGENVSTRTASTTAGRTAFQAHLDDEVEAKRISRSQEIDDEFNLKAAEAPDSRPRLRQTYRPLLGLSVLVATHGRPQGLRRLLAALRPQIQDHPERNVVVVNDGSHDAAYAEVAAEFADVIDYTPLPKASALGEVRNAAVIRSRGAYVVFTDDDCEPPPWWLDWLAARLSVHPEIDVVIGTTMPLWNKRSFRERLEGEWFLPQPTYFGRWHVFITANVAIRADVLREVGGFLPALQVGEDTELCIRLHRAGARFLIDEQWWVKHEVGKPISALARRYRAYGEARSRIGSISSVEVTTRLSSGLAGHVATIAGLWRDYNKDVASFPGPLERWAAAGAAAIVMYAYYRGIGRDPSVTTRFVQERNG